MAKHITDKQVSSKREEVQIIAVKNMGESSENDYDYRNLESAYKEELKNLVNSNETLNHTEVKEEELIKEAVNKLVDFKETPRNCSEEEKKGIGMGAVECVWLDLKKPKSEGSRIQILQRIGRLVLIWFCVYLAIAIPCWCQRGNIYKTKPLIQNILFI